MKATQSANGKMLLICIFQEAPQNDSVRLSAGLIWSPIPNKNNGSSKRNLSNNLHHLQVLDSQV
ncbi:hypothetical protein DY000_02059105 [Brassica cretica]|nr:hypothetical protein DY000_02059105 [Brassica cretica]